MSGGYGIAGHKNTFKSGVRLGNWVEEQFGRELVEQRGPPPRSDVSECKRQYQRPTAEETRAASALNPEAALNREGLPSHVLFGHGRTEHVDPDAESGNRFATMSQVALATGAKSPTRAQEVAAAGAARGAQRQAVLAETASSRTELGRTKARRDEDDANVRLRPPQRAPAGRYPRSGPDPAPPPRPAQDDLYRSVTAKEMAHSGEVKSQRVAYARTHTGFTRTFRAGIPGLRR